MNAHPKAPAVNPRIEICCRIDSSMLGLLREFVRAVAEYLDFSPTETSQIEICVDEACTNALEHAYRGNANVVETNKELTIEIFFRDGELTIRVVDHGCGMSEPETVFSSLEEYAAPDRHRYRGLGLYMIRKFMDRVEVRSEPGKGTSVEMTKVRR
jgi:stage II sporulation protein AB (anti-sigma F factor)